MTKRVLGLLLFVMAFAGAARGVTGDCEKNAAEIKFSPAGGIRTVQLVKFRDVEAESKDEKFDEDLGVYYFKATLKRGYSYTIWTEGLKQPGTNETEKTEISISPYAAESETKEEPSADFTELEEAGDDVRFVLFSDDWYVDPDDPDASDPKEWTYYIEIIGGVGDRVELHFQQGVVIPQGRAENPLSVVPKVELIQIEKQLQLGGEFHLRARLTAGRLYWFATSGGATNNVLDVEIEPDDSTVTEDDLPAGVIIYDDPAYDGDADNYGMFVSPEVTGYYNLVVSGTNPYESGEDESQLPTFGFLYQMFDQRTIAEHAAATVLLAPGVEVTARPGGVNSSANLAARIYDNVIDEDLFRFDTIKGVRYLVQTSGAGTNLVMRIYDAKGGIVTENFGNGESFDVCCGFTATATGVYYAGVAQDLVDEFRDVPSRAEVMVRMEQVESRAGAPDGWDNADDEPAGASVLTVLPGMKWDLPEEVDVEGHGSHRLDGGDWADVFVVCARKGVVYALNAAVEDADGNRNTFAAEVFTLSGTREIAVETFGDVNSTYQPLVFEATANALYYVRLSVAEGPGLESSAYRVHAIGYAADGSELGLLKVGTRGADATWSLGTETVKYPSGGSVLVSGERTVKFTAVTGCKADAVTRIVTVTPGETALVEALYSDTFDPKDNTAVGATAWTLKNTSVTMNRTLWANDPADHFAFAGKDGQYYDFALENKDGSDAVFSITNATGDAAHPDGVFAANVTEVTHLALPTARTKYYLVVKHTGAGEGAYALSGFFANVGAIKFAKTALTVNENAPSVAVAVNRTAKDGVVRVKYATVADTAQPGVDFIAQEGVLEWAANDNKPRTITVKLIPDLVAEYEGGNKTFGIRLEPFEPEAANEYPAQIAGGDTCTVTLKEVSRAGTTVASTYAAKAPKPATVVTEKVALETGTFYGVLQEEGETLTNGLPRLASVTFTCSTARPAALSAKVALAGKTYTFAAKGWDVTNDVEAVKAFTLVQRVNNVSYTNRLTIAVAAGATTNGVDWRVSGGTAELMMNVPDANAKGVQKNVAYTGRLFRNNAKIQDYLTAVTNFTGYYTVSLKPDVEVGSGVPAGNGYLTLTVSNKGDVKVAGMLADGVTKPSFTVKACALVKDGESANGWSLWVPIFQAKSPCCFGGLLRLVAVPAADLPSGAPWVVVADASRTLVWNNDNAALTYGGKAGYRIRLTPCGGWYDNVFCLQTYYKSAAFAVDTIDIEEFPAESFAAGYSPVSLVQPDSSAVNLAVDTFSTGKQTLRKVGSQVDFAASVNPCNVQVKVVRATGLVSGSLVLWGQNGTLQKQMTGLKHYGVLVLSRAKDSLADEKISGGFLIQPITVNGVNPVTNLKTSRKVNFSVPFDLLWLNSTDD